jgi:hypothetical protein
LFFTLSHSKRWKLHSAGILSHGRGNGLHFVGDEHAYAAENSTAHLQQAAFHFWEARLGQHLAAMMVQKFVMLFLPR